MTTLTAALASTLIRKILEDYNYWPGSEGDSPLKVSRSKVLADDKLVLSRDASMRRAAMKKANPTATGYKVPNRVVEPCTIDMCIGGKLVAAKAELDAACVGLTATNLMPAVGMEMPAEKLEFLVQLFNAFKLLNNPRCYIVRDVADVAPTVALTQSGNKITAKITSFPVGAIVRFSYVMGNELIVEDNTSPYTCTLTKAGEVRVDVIGAAGSLAFATIAATYTAPTTPPAPTPAPAPLPAPTGGTFMPDAFTGLFLVGETTDGESVIAATLLIET